MNFSRVMSVFSAWVLSISVLAGCTVKSSPETAPSGKPVKEETVTHIKTVTVETTYEGKPDTQPENLEIAHSGYYVDQAGYVHYAVEIYNPNKDCKANSIALTVTGKNAEGVILFSTDAYVNTIYPVETIWYASQAGEGMAPDTVEFRLSVLQSNWTKSDEVNPTFYTYFNVNFVPNTTGGKITGEIKTEKEVLINGKPAERAWLSVVLKNSRGQVVGGFGEMISVEEPGMGRPFDVNLYGGPEFSDYEVYAIPWS